MVQGPKLDQICPVHYNSKLKRAGFLLSAAWLLCAMNLLLVLLFQTRERVKERESE